MEEGKDSKRSCPNPLKVEFKQELFSFPVVFNTTHSFFGIGFQGLYCFNRSALASQTLELQALETTQSIGSAHWL